MPFIQNNYFKDKLPYKHGYHNAWEYDLADVEDGQQRVNNFLQKLPIHPGFGVINADLDWFPVDIESKEYSLEEV